MKELGFTKSALSLRTSLLFLLPTAIRQGPECDTLTKKADTISFSKGLESSDVKVIINQ
jgi:hypothetical protein